MRHLVQPTTGTECAFLNKFPQELRDQIYDYVAMTETKIGAHITLDDANVKIHAYSYKGLGHTCRQIRREYSLRLQHRIKLLITELNTANMSTTKPRKPIRDPGPRKMGLLQRLALFRNASIEPPVPALDHSAHSHVLRVAERKVTRGVYAQEDVAYTYTIPFGGIYDGLCLPFPGANDADLRLSTLTVTLASSAPREYNQTYPLDPLRDESDFWISKGHFDSIYHAARIFLRLTKRADWTGRIEWWSLWWDYEIMFPRMKGEKGNGLQGRTGKDRWWETFGACFRYPTTTECIIEHAS